MPGLLVSMPAAAAASSAVFGPSQKRTLPSG
jgi:hypothetical protein